MYKTTPSYQMYSAAGNAAVHKMIEALRTYAGKTCSHCGRMPTESELRGELEERMEKVGRYYTEVYDTDVRDAIWDATKDIWKAAGYDTHDLEAQLF